MISIRSCFFPDQRDCDIYIIHSFNWDNYLERVQKLTLSPFNDKRCYEIILKVNQGKEILTGWNCISTRNRYVKNNLFLIFHQHSSRLSNFIH